MFNWMFYDSNDNSKTINLPSQSYRSSEHYWFEYPIMAKRIRLFGDTNDQIICLPVRISTSNFIFKDFLPVLNIQINPKNEIFFDIFILNWVICPLLRAFSRIRNLLFRISMENSRGKSKSLEFQWGLSKFEKKRKFLGGKCKKLEISGKPW